MQISDQMIATLEYVRRVFPDASPDYIETTALSVLQQIRRIAMDAQACAPEDPAFGADVASDAVPEEAGLQIVDDGGGL